jgi:uncharacterized protein DUF6883
MLIPNSEGAHVPIEKLLTYLLSESHPSGKTKARFFRAHGYNETNAELLAEAIREIARTRSVQETAESPFGTKYVVEGSIKTPRGTDVRVRTVWVLEPGFDAPRLVTAYPA